MQDQPAMGVRHGAEHLQEQSHSRFDRKTARVAPDVDRLALNVLKDNVRLSRTDPSIYQVSDVPMRKFREGIGFEAQPFRAAAAERSEVQQLDRGLSFVAPVTTLGEPHAPHATLAEWTIESEAAEAAAGKLRQAERIDYARFEETLFAHGLVVRQQPGDVIAQRGILRTDLGQPRSPLGRIEVQQFIEQSADGLPASACHLGHGHPRSDVLEGAAHRIPPIFAGWTRNPATATVMSCAHY